MLRKYEKYVAYINMKNAYYICSNNNEYNINSSNNIWRKVYCLFYILFFVTSLIKSILIRSKGISRARDTHLLLARLFVRPAIRQFPATSNWRNGKGSDGIPDKRGTTNRSHISHHERFPQWTFFRSLITRYRHIPLLVTSSVTAASRTVSCALSLPVCRLRNCHGVRR